MYAFRTKKDPRLPKSFVDVIKDRKWCEAIGREYNTLIHRETWTYISRTDDMSLLPFTLVFRLKPLDEDENLVLCKARCCVRGDLQEALLDYGPEATYAPVASHESIGTLLAIAAQDGLIAEGGDVENAYLYGDIDAEFIIEQPTNSSGKEYHPGKVCRLLKSMYGLNHIWDSVLCNTSLQWGFKQSRIDHRVFFKVSDNMFVVLVIVVDDMKFVSNAPLLLDYLKDKLRSTFHVKLFGSFRAFTRWEVSQNYE